MGGGGGGATVYFSTFCLLFKTRKSITFLKNRLCAYMNFCQGQVWLWRRRVSSRIPEGKKFKFSLKMLLRAFLQNFSNLNLISTSCRLVPISKATRPVVPLSTSSLLHRKQKTIKLTPILRIAKTE